VDRAGQALFLYDIVLLKFLYNSCYNCLEWVTEVVVIVMCCRLGPLRMDLHAFQQPLC
jgi:membrane protein required for beta-lactamase induction